MLVTVKQAADHLRLDDYGDEIADLTLKIEAASEIILGYVEQEEADYPEDSNGDSTVPKTLQVAVLLLLGDMHRHRDSDMPNYKDKAFLPSAVRSLLFQSKTWGLEDD